jgi:hypothetical protein
MTAPSSIDPTRFLDEQLAQASPDLLRQDHVHQHADVGRGRRGPRRPVRDAVTGADERAQRLPAPRVRHPRRCGCASWPWPDGSSAPRRRVLHIDPAWPWADQITTAHQRLCALPAP